MSKDDPARIHCTYCQVEKGRVRPALVTRDERLHIIGQARIVKNYITRVEKLFVYDACKLNRKAPSPELKIELRDERIEWNSSLGMDPLGEGLNSPRRIKLLLFIG